MKKTFLPSVFFALASVAPAAADTFQAFVYTAGDFKTIELPGAPSGINDAGQIVGAFLDPNAGFLNRGFLYDAGALTTIDVPGAIHTLASKVNDAGQVVGISSSGSAHGFLYDSGAYTTIDMPGAVLSAASAINDAGQILGSYQNAARPGIADGIQRTFLYDAGTFTTIDVPGFFGGDLNDAGQILGGVADAHGRGQLALLDATGSLTVFTVPGSLWSSGQAINDAGQIVGYYSDGKDFHGFLYDSGVFTNIDLPGRWTFATGINDAGQIVGFSTEIPAPEPGSMLLLGTGLAGVWGAATRKHRSVSPTVAIRRTRR